MSMAESLRLENQRVYPALDYPDVTVAPAANGAEGVLAW